MSDDYYEILGISRGASIDEIEKAHRKLARKYHPDVNPDDERAKKRFQQVQHAYDVLSDADKRAKYDRFGSNFDHAGGGGPSFGGMDLDDILQGGFSQGGFGFEDILRQFGGAAGPSAGRQPAPTRGQDIQRQLDIPFHTAVLGGEVQLAAQRPDGKQERINVKIPAGISQAAKVRIAGKGHPAAPGGKPGDIIITVQIAGHPCFRRRGRDLEVDLPVTVTEAMRGATIDVPTPYGTIALTVPAGTSGGQRLRIKDHGLATADGKGHLYVVVQIQIPEDVTVDDDLLASLDELYDGDPRDGIRWD
jgi:DnaJ-class molecular chaperone